MWENLTQLSNFTSIRFLFKERYNRKQNEDPSVLLCHILTIVGLNSEAVNNNNWLSGQETHHTLVVA